MERDSLIKEPTIGAIFDHLLKESNIKEEDLWKNGQIGKEGELTPLGVLIYTYFLMGIYIEYMKLLIEKIRP